MFNSLLVTGANGFIGRELLTSLSNTCFKVVACYRHKDKLSKTYVKSDNIDYVKVDIRAPSDFKAIQQDIDVVVHLAAEIHSHKNSNNFRESIESNLLGTYNLLEFCKNNKVKKLLYMSSKTVYGEPRSNKITEKHPTTPGGVAFNYGFGKLAGEMLCDCYTRELGIKLVNLRMSPVYGHSQESWFLIPRIVRQVKNKHKLQIKGDGTNIMDFLHVYDCVEAILKSIDSDQVGTFNIGPLSYVTLSEMIDKIVSIFSDSKSINVVYDSSVPIYKNFIMDITLARTKLGFKPTIQLVEGLKLFK